MYLFRQTFIRRRIFGIKAFKSNNKEFRLSRTCYDMHVAFKIRIKGLFFFLQLMPGVAFLSWGGGGGGGGGGLYS